MSEFQFIETCLLINVLMFFVQIHLKEAQKMFDIGIYLDLKHS